MLGAFVDGLFKGLEFHEKLYDVKRKKMLSRAAEEYLKRGDEGETKAALPEGKKLDGKTGGAGTAPLETEALPAPQTTSQTPSATAADELRATPASRDKPTSQKLKDQVTDGSLEGDITMGRPYTGLPVPSGPALGFDASENMGGVPMRPSTGVFRSATAADYQPPGYLARTGNRAYNYLAPPLGNAYGGFSQLGGALGGGLTALGEFGNQAARALVPSALVPRQPGSTLVDPNYFDPDKRSY